MTWIGWSWSLDSKTPWTDFVALKWPPECQESTGRWHFRKGCSHQPPRYWGHGQFSSFERHELLLGWDLVGQSCYGGWLDSQWWGLGLLDLVTNACPSFQDCRDDQVGDLEYQSYRILDLNPSLLFQDWFDLIEGTEQVQQLHIVDVFWMVTD